MSSVLIEQGNLDRHAQKEVKGHVTTGHASTSQEIPRIAGATQGKESGRQFLPQTVQKDPTLPTAGSQTLGLLNYERMNFCCLGSSQVCGDLLAAGKLIWHLLQLFIARVNGHKPFPDQ